MSIKLFWDKVGTYPDIYYIYNTLLFWETFSRLLFYNTIAILTQQNIAKFASDIRNVVRLWLKWKNKHYVCSYELT